MSSGYSKLGYAQNWADFTLCEAFAQHFDNTVGNVGPIYVVNVLDPDVHRVVWTPLTEDARLQVNVREEAVIMITPE